MKFTKLDYYQYLLSSQINYTITNLASHLENISHDKINNYLKNEKLTPRLLWDNVKSLIVPHEDAYIIFWENSEQCRSDNHEGFKERCISIPLSS